MPELRMTKPRLAILRACTEMTANGPRIYSVGDGVIDAKTNVRVTAVVHYLLTRGLLGATRVGEYEGKTRVRYTPTRAGREWLAKDTTEEESNG